MTKLRILIVAFLALAWPALAQVPGASPPGVQQGGQVTRGHGVQWMTNGVIGDSGGPSVAGSNTSGTFVCPTITVVKGIITAASSNSCGGPSPSAVLLIGGDVTSCLLIGGDGTSCLLLGGS